jgi:type I restriction enzyme M protein
LELRPSHLEGNDIIGGAYEYLIENFASDAGKKAGEFYTPK